MKNGALTTVCARTTDSVVKGIGLPSAWVG